MVWRIAARVVGYAILFLAFLMAMMLFLFVRLDDGDDLYTAYRDDVLTGLAIAIGLFLVGIPPAGKLTKRSLSLLAITTLGVGIVIGGMLAYRHFEQDQIRSTPPSSHARHQVTDAG